MALPVTIAGVAFSPNHWRIGPFKSSGGNFYIPFLDSTDTSIVEMWKATDPTSAFAEVDSADKPDLTGLAGSIWAFQVSDVLHIATQEVTTGRIGYHTFNMATDQWAVVNEEAHVPANDPLNYGVSIGLRSDGDVLIFHYIATDNVAAVEYRRVGYSRREAAVWTSGVAVSDAAAADDFTGPMMVIDSADRAHLVWRNDDLDDGLHRTLNSSNALSGTTTAYDATADPGERTMTANPPLVYTRGGNETFAVGYLDVGSTPALAYGTVADVVTFSLEAISADVVDRPNVTADFTLATYNTKLYMLYVEDVTNDLFLATDESGSWVTSELLDAVNVLRCSGNIYIRGTNYVFGYAYLDGANVKYNEYVVAAVTTGIARIMTGVVIGSHGRGLVA